MSKLNIVAIFTIKAEFKSEFQQEFTKIVNASRLEEGCVRYELNQDIQDPNTYIFIETWASQSAFDQHNAGANFQHFAKFIDGKVAKQAIHVLKTYL